VRVEPGDADQPQAVDDELGDVLGEGAGVAGPGGELADVHERVLTLQGGEEGPWVHAGDGSRALRGPGGLRRPGCRLAAWQAGGTG
jgi:hypothetical protein